MPSPVGHALGALAAAWAADAPRAGRRTLAVRAAVVALVGMAPDLDLLWGRHSRETHSIGAACLAAVVAWLVVPRERWRWASLVGLAWISHPLLDVLGADSSPPRGVQLWWPLSDAFVIAPQPIFDAISRMWWRDDVWAHNFAALGRELIILVPIVAAVFWWRRPRRDNP
jgi:membrane-bound metal-dependent hydrolase YbcI (DUF457 family)